MLYYDLTFISSFSDVPIGQSISYGILVFILLCCDSLLYTFYMA